MNEGVETMAVNSESNVQPSASEEKVVDHLDEISKNSRTTFYALIIACIYSYLAISTTSDAALLTNSGATPLPIIQVRVPIVWFYYFAPILLFALFLYFHFYLERFWYSVARLPLIHPEDRRRLDDYLYPWLISTTFIRGIHPELGRDRPQLYIEYVLCLILAWWFIPIILFFYWARYLAAHEWKGTLLHSLLLVAAIGFACRFYYLAKNAVTAVPAGADRRLYDYQRSKMAFRFTPRQISWASAATFILAGAVFYLSLSAFHGIQAFDKETVIVEDAYTMFTPGTTFLKWLGVQTSADIKEKRLVAKPPNWQELLSNEKALQSYLDTQDRLKLKRMNLRHIDARNAFLPASELKNISFDYGLLEHAILTSSKLENVSFRGARLTHADFQYTKMSGVVFENVVADVARFSHTRFIPNPETGDTTFSGEYYDAGFEHSVGHRLHFKDAELQQTNFRNAKISFSFFQNVDLASAKLQNSELMENRFVNTDFSNAQMQETDLRASKFEDCKFISSAMKETIFEDAMLIKSEFDSSEQLSGGTLESDSEAASNTIPNVIDTFYGSGIQLKSVSIKNTHFINHSDFRLALFEDVTFENTKFLNADFSGATFKNTDLSGVSFIDAEFNGADLTDTSGLAEHHLANMCGNDDTKLPAGISPLKSCFQLN